MLYFAYGSNLNHFQMKRRCKDSTFIKKINLKGYTLNFRSKYRAADIEKKINSIVPGALYEISKSDALFKLKEQYELAKNDIIDFCELDWEKQCLEFHKNKRQVRTASIEQVRQPMNNKSIGAWKKYENYLSEMLAELN